MNVRAECLDIEHPRSSNGQVQCIQLPISAAYLPALTIRSGACCVPDRESGRGGIQWESKPQDFWAANWDGTGDTKARLLALLTAFKIQKAGQVPSLR